MLQQKKPFYRVVWVFLLILISVWGAQAARVSLEYPYGSLQFNILVKDSYMETGENNDKLFFDWLENAYRLWNDTSPKSRLPFLEDQNDLDFSKFRQSVKQQLLEIPDPVEKARSELVLLQWLHRFIKSAIPRFSLERGYEFKNVVRYGERQCLLQSVLMAALLQDMGVDAGVVMIYKNQAGEETNNGHATVLVRLSNGNHIILDASHKEAFVKHRGIFARSSSKYHYFIPVFGASLSTDAIYSYQEAGSEKEVKNDLVTGLDFSFIRSQFDVYRGEWVKGGLHDKEKTSEGLLRTLDYFQKSLKNCGDNPLAIYFLARTYEEMEKDTLAQEYFSKALYAYERYGWIPGGLKEKTKKGFEDRRAILNK